MKRGDLIFAAADPLRASRDQRATVCWFADYRLCKGEEFVVKHTTRLTTAEVVEVTRKLDLDTLRFEPATYLQTNDIGVVRWRLADDIVADPYKSAGSLVASS